MRNAITCSSTAICNSAFFGIKDNKLSAPNNVVIQATHFDLVETSVIVMTTKVSYSGLYPDDQGSSNEKDVVHVFILIWPMELTRTKTVTVLSL